MSVCKNCGVEIDWIFTQEQKYRPVDPEPVFVIEGDGQEKFIQDDGEIIVGRIACPEEVQSKEAKINTPLGFVPHWRTCLRADKPAQRRTERGGDYGGLLPAT